MMAVALLIAGLLQTAHAAETMTIVDVRRNITLSEEETPYKDFYIAAGADSGLKKNLVVTAVRKINVRDAAGANAVGEIAVPVGQLKVIAVYDKVAVAREFTLLSRDELPMLEQIGIMTGDKIDLRGSFIDTSKPKPKRKVAEVTGATTTTTTVTTVTTVPAMPMILPAAAPTAPVAAQTGTPAVPGKDLQAVAVPAQLQAQAPVSTGEKLEKVADSGNTSGHE
ncbi:MAG: hypothetical protein J7501_09405 [Bdellovibrio sp.]|nr:hypothetical protein [Bdellovibrio sp.]